jgi:hypothetical protein
MIGLENFKGFENIIGSACKLQILSEKNARLDMALEPVFFKHMYTPNACRFFRAFILIISDNGRHRTLISCNHTDYVLPIFSL